MLSNFDLSEKTAIITGGGGLLGKQHAHALLEIGANVILADINADAAEAQAMDLNSVGMQGKAFSQRMDVTNETQIREVLDAGKIQFGHIDILINNAAIDPKVQANALINSSRLENFSIDDWNFQVSVGLSGAFLCSKIFGTEMAKRRSGVILNIASDLSVIAPDQRLYEIEGVEPEMQSVKPITYSVIKSGLIGMTKYLSTYWHGAGVRVNALSPGGVLNEQNKDFLDKVRQRIPLGRLSEKGEYRSAVQFLCSDASSYMTGQNMVIDGGRSIW